MGAFALHFGGQLTPAENAGVDRKRSSAGGNNTAAGYLMCQSTYRKVRKQTLAKRLMLTDFLGLCGWMVLPLRGEYG